MKTYVDVHRTRPDISLWPGIICTIVLTIFQFSPAKLMAADTMIPLELPEPNFFGVGMGVYPDYFGSDDTAFGAIPLGRMTMGGGQYVSLLASDIRVNLLNASGWRLGPEFLYRFGRDDIDDEVVEKVHEIDDSAELGLFGGYNWKDPLEIRKQAGFSVWTLFDVSGVHDGWTAGASVYGMYPVARPITIGAGGGATYGNNDYTDTYFGITDSDSMSSALTVYSPNGGMRDARAWVVAMLHLSPRWHTGIGLIYSRILGDAADSPIVKDRGSRDQWIYGVGVLYNW